MTTTTRTSEKTMAEYVQENWAYFGRNWRSVTAAIKHYQNNPSDLEHERVGVNFFTHISHMAEYPSE